MGQCSEAIGPMAVKASLHVLLNTLTNMYRTVVPSLSP